MLSYDACMNPRRPEARNRSVTGHPQPGPGAAAELDRLQEEFPGFRIWREAMGDRVRYLARRRSPGTRPYAVVTADPRELRTALGGQPPCTG